MKKISFLPFMALAMAAVGAFAFRADTLPENQGWFPYNSSTQTYSQVEDPQIQGHCEEGDEICAGLFEKDPVTGQRTGSLLDTRPGLYNPE